MSVRTDSYRSNTIPVDQLYTLPALAPFGELNAYGFSLAGYRVTAKIDPRPLPPSCKPYTLNRKNVLRGFFVDFEDTPEFRRTIEMKIRNEDRNSKAKRPEALKC